MARLELLAVGVICLIIGWIFVPIITVLSGLSTSTIEGFLLCNIVTLMGIVFIGAGVVMKNA